MNFKKYLFMGAALMALSFFAACSDDENEPQTPPKDPEGEQPGESTSLADQWNNTNTVVWPADTVVNLTDHYVVPEGMITEEEVPEYAGLIYVSKADRPNAVFSTCTIIKDAPRLKKEKTNLNELNLTNKFYYAYRQWKQNTFGRMTDLKFLKEEYNALLEEQGVTNKFKDLNDEIERLKIELDETENLAKAMSKRAKEESKHAEHLERLLRQNNIEFD